MRYNTVLFDLDGTLLYTLKDIKDSLNEALKSCFLPEKNEDEVRLAVGNGVERLVELSVDGGKSNEKYTAVLDFFLTHYKAHCNDNTRAYEGIDGLLSELNEKGLKVAVISNKFDTATKELCKKFFDGKYDIACGSSPDVKKKPCPDVVFKVLRELGSDIKDSVIVGDSEVDVETARAANTDCIAVCWGFRNKDTLKESGASVFAENTEELRTLLLA